MTKFFGMIGLSAMLAMSAMAQPYHHPYPNQRYGWYDDEGRWQGHWGPHGHWHLRHGVWYYHW